LYIDVRLWLGHLIFTLHNGDAFNEIEKIENNPNFF
jgi:hypothetical protein